MKITKTPPKRNPPPISPLPVVIETLSKSLSANEPVIIEEWKFPKADLYHFVAVLNLIDEFYAKIVSEYFQVDRAQETDKASTAVHLKPFTEQNKSLLINYLNFSRILLDHATNRNLYNSYEHLNTFLYSDDLEVVVVVLKLLQRPASRLHSQQRTLKNLFKSSVNADRLLQLTYHEISLNALPEKDLHVLYAQVCPQKDRPSKESLSLQCFLLVKLLSSAVYLYLINNDTNPIFADYNLISALCSMLGSSAEYSVLSAAVSLLDAAYLQKSKQSEILASLNLHSNASLLLFLFSKSIAELKKSTENPLKIVELCDNILSLVSTLISTQQGASVLSNTGVISNLLGSLSVNSAQVSIKVISILDAILYSSPNFFAAGFVTTKIDEEEALPFLIKKAHALTLDIEQNSSKSDDGNGKSPFDFGFHEKISILKSILKFLLHVMQSHSGVDKVRNFIESPLVDVMKHILDNQKSFQPQIHALSINLMATFIHNEPTSFSQLEERKIPSQFITTVSQNTFSSVDVISAIPHAIGAICLNNIGLEKVLDISPFKHYFSMFFSEEHIRALLDEDMSSFLGHAFDELIRHHPPLKDQVFEGAMNALSFIVDMKESKSFLHDVDLFVNELDPSIDVPMVEKETKGRPAEDVLQLLFFELMVRFFEGLFQHTNHCKDLLEKHPQFVDVMLCIYRSESLTYDFASSAISYSLSHVFRVVSDIQPDSVLKKLLALLKQTLDNDKLQLRYKGKDSLVLPLINLRREYESEASELFKALKKVHSVVGLFCDVYSSPTFTSSKGNPTVIEIFATEGRESILGLMDVYIWCAIESVGVRYGIPEKWVSKRDIGVKVPNSPFEAAAVDSESKKICDPDDPRIRNLKMFKYLLSQTTAFIVPLFQGLCRTLLTKRSDSKQKSNALKISSYFEEAIEKIVSCDRVAELDFNDVVVSAKKRFQYYHICGGVIHTILTDERNSSTQVSVVSWTFIQNGLQKFMKVAETLAQDAVEIRSVMSDKKNSSKEAAKIAADIQLRAYRAVEGFLAVLLLIVDQKSLLDSNHTSFLFNITVEDRIKEGKFKYSSQSHLCLARKLVLDQLVKWIPELVTESGELNAESTWLKLDGNPLVILMQVLLKILKKDGEKEFVDEKTRTSTAQQIIDILNGKGTTTNSADPSRVRILQDMGFTEQEANSALSQNAGNVMLAAEFLLRGEGQTSNPTDTPNVPPPQTSEGAAQTIIEDIQVAQMEAVTDDGNDDYEDMEDEEEANNDNEEDDSHEEEDDNENYEDEDSDDKQEDEKKKTFSANPFKNLGDTRYAPALNSTRDTVVKVFSSKILKFASKASAIVFELRDFTQYLFKISKDQNSFFKTELPLTEYFKKIFVSLETDHVATGRELHLLALFANDALMSKKFLESMNVQDFTSCLATLPDLFTNSKIDEIGTESILLILEALFKASLSPEEVSLSIPEFKNQVPLLVEPYVNFLNTVNTSEILRIVVDLMKQKATKEIRHNCLRLILLLTRNSKIADEFVEMNGVSLLLELKDVFSGEMTLKILILRHLIESPVILQNTIKKEIYLHFTSPRDRNSDMNGILKNMAHIVLRDPNVYLESFVELVKITKDPLGKNPTITLKKTEENESMGIETFKEIMAKESYTSSMQASIVHDLLERLLSYQKPISNTHKSPKNSRLSAPAEHLDQSRCNFLKCFYMQCLCELFSAYPSIKIQLLHFSKKKSGKDGHLRGFKIFLSYLLNDLIPYPKVHSREDKEKIDTEVLNQSNWACNLLSIICNFDVCKFDPKNMEEEQLPEFFNIPKLVLDGILKSIKDAGNIQDQEKKQGKLQSIFELLLKLLTSDTPSSPAFDRLGLSDDKSIPPISYFMIRKKFVPQLLSLLDEIETASPTSKHLLNAILKPLELLTKNANNISREAKQDQDEPSVEKKKVKSLIDDVNSSSSNLRAEVSSVSDMNFIRDSALGVFSPHSAAMETDEDEDSNDEDEEEDEDSMEESDMDVGMDEIAEYTDMSDESDDSESNSRPREPEEMEIVVRTAPFSDEDFSGDDDESPHHLHESDFSDLSEEREWETDDDDEDLPDDVQDVIEENMESMDDDGVHGENDDEHNSEHYEDDMDEDMGMVDDMYADEMDDIGGEDIHLDDMFENVEIDPNGFITIHPRAMRIGMSGSTHRRRNRQQFEPFMDDEDQDNGLMPPVLLNDLIDDGSRVQAVHQNAPSLHDPVPSHPLLDRTNDVNRPSQDRHSYQPIDIAAANPLANNALQVLEQLFNLNHSNFRVERVESTTQGTLPGTSRIHGISTLSENLPATSNKFSSEFYQVRPSERWWQESRMIFGNFVADKAQLLQNAIKNKLVPLALEEEKLLKQKEEKEMAEKAAATTQKAQEEEKIKAQKLEEETEIEQKTESMDIDAHPATIIAPETEAESSPEVASGPNMIAINGINIDLANTGIDPTFLEALPDELRAEVLAQHLREQGDLTMSTAFPGEISPVFLNALPPDIREEVVQLRNAEAASSLRIDGAFGGTGVIASNTFLEAFERGIQEVMANAGSRINDNIFAHGNSSAVQEIFKDKTTKDKKLQSIEPDQIVEKQSLLGLLRIYFGIQATSLHNKAQFVHLFSDFCENEKSRAELILILLNLIQEAVYDIRIGDATSPNKSQLSKKLPQTPSRKPLTHLQAVLDKKTADSITEGSSLVQLVQKSLDLLLDLVTKIERMKQFFLIENENVNICQPFGVKSLKRTRIKAKSIQASYPLSALLTLLNVPIFYKNTPLCDALTQLIAAVTKPLNENQAKDASK